jgi:peptidoglycan/LPS O-acetylase OafA/YrhL
VSVSSPARERPRTEHVPSLDGIRAVGVVLVFLFHLRVAGFDAGFLGVDIFFVLSGFLITTLLLNEMRETGRIALAGFWSRRIRRLMPALVVVLLVIAIVTGLTATFSERRSVRGDLIATTAYVANWRFISTSSYFENTGVESPLQHTWSLGIEEQFYLLWPLLLALLIPLLRRPRLTVAIPALLGATASALALAWLWTPILTDRAYMGTDARIFEPLIGAVAAVVIASPQGRAAVDRAGTWLVVVGGVGLVWLLTVIRPAESFYFYGGAVAVSICTAMVMMPLWIGKGGALRRVLGWGPVAFLGVISYGVYLWHWPFILWLGIRQRQGIDLFARSILAVVLTIAVSTLSYYAIERPIRRGIRPGVHRERAVRRRPVIVLAIVPLVMVSVIGVSLATTQVAPPPPGVPVVMLVGDSVPHRLEAAMDRMGESRGWRIVSEAQGACSVTGETEISVDGELIHEARACPDVPAAQDSLIRESDPDVVVWWDRWSVSSFVSADGERVISGTPRFWELRRSILQDAVERLTVQGAKVLFIGTEPPGMAAAERCEIASCPQWRQFLIDHYVDITSRWNEIMSRYASQHPEIASYASLTEVICRRDVAPCDDSINGVPARVDGSHYGAVGEKVAAEAIGGFIEPLL